MQKLVPVAAVGLAFVLIGCQEPATAKPPETPQGAQPAGSPPPAASASAAAHGDGDHGRGDHHGGAGGWPHREGAEGTATGPRDQMRHHEGGGDEAMEHHVREMHGEHDMEGAHHGKPMGPPGGRMGHEGGEEMLRELAALGVHLYPPPMLLNRSKDLGLTPDQTNKIRQEMLTAHSRAIDLHAKVEHSKLEIQKLMTAEKVDEKAIGAQIDEAAKAEAEMHKLHVGTLLHVRALLTPEQTKKLDEMKPEHHMHEGPEHRGARAEHHE